MDRETADEIERHVNVVAEGLRSEIRTVAERIGANFYRIDSLDERLDRFESRITEEFGKVKAMIQLSRAGN